MHGSDQDRETVLSEVAARPQRVAAVLSSPAAPTGSRGRACCASTWSGDRAIPAEFYRAVANLLVYVMTRKGR
jgi:hypothetical protein